MKTRSKAEIARDTRWKLPSLNRLGFNEMTLLMEQIQEDIDNIHYFIDNGDETFMEAMDGDEDEEREFRMAFSELEAEAEEIQRIVSEYSEWNSLASSFADLMNDKERAVFQGDIDYDDYDEDNEPYNSCRAYDDCTVALIGKRYNFGVNGYDTYERDVFGLGDDSMSEYATEQAQKRLLRLKKAEIVELVGQSVSIMLRFQTFYVRYTLLTQTFEQVRGANLATLNLIKDINAAYEDLAPELERNCRYGRHDPEYMFISGVKASAAVRRFDRLLEKLPDRFWVE